MNNYLTHMNTRFSKISTIRTLFVTLALLAVTLGGSQIASAAENEKTLFGKKAKGKWIIGVKLAKIDTNVEEIKDADGVGVVLAYEFDKLIGGSGTSTVEFEYISGNQTDILGIADYDSDIANLFFTYRSPGILYYKAKLGLSYSTLEISAFGDSFDTDDVSIAGGIGLGYQIGDYGVVELEYSAGTGSQELFVDTFNDTLGFQRQVLESPGIISLSALLEF